MAQFIWKDRPTYGTCTTCGTSSCTEGFVDLISQVDITRGDMNIVGNVDIVLCSDCITQAARSVGCIPAYEAEALSWNVSELTDAVEKAADEANAWQQRYENIVEIMSMVQLSQDVTPGNSSVDSSDNLPDPDLRVQEGRDLPPKSNGKTKAGSGGKRSAATR